VAASGVGAGVAQAVGGNIGGQAYTNKAGEQVSATFGNFAASTAAGAIANAATRSAINGESFGDNLIAAIPDVIALMLQRAMGTALDGVTSKPETQVAEKPVAGAGTANTVAENAATIIVSAQSANGADGVSAAPVKEEESKPPAGNIDPSGQKIEPRADPGAVKMFLDKMPTDEYDATQIEAARRIAWSIFGDRDKISEKSKEWRLAIKWRDEFVADGQPSSGTVDEFVILSQDRGFFWTQNRDTMAMEKTQIKYGEPYKFIDINGDEKRAPKEQFFYIYQNGLVESPPLVVLPQSTRSNFTQYKPEYVPLATPGLRLAAVAHVHQTQGFQGFQPGPKDGTTPYDLGVPNYGLGEGPIKYPFEV
jgi:hypothetical protein